MSGIRIVSDGTSMNTKIYDESGNQIMTVTEIIVHPITCHTREIKATLTFRDVKLDLKDVKETYNEPNKIEGGTK